MRTPLYQLRFYDDRDYEKVAEWFSFHGSAPPPRAILPKMGAICQMDGEDAAALWVYMDNSVGVCWAEYAVTAPSLSLRHAKQALWHLFTFLRHAAKEYNYGLMRVTTLPAIARVLEKHGFVRDPRRLVTLYGSTKENV